MSNIDEEVLDRLEAEAKVADADAEELTIAVESDLEEKDSTVEELQQEVDEKEARVEELQSKVEEKESVVEELQEEVSEVKDFYAQHLSGETFTAEELKAKFDVGELREKFAEAADKPDPSSADTGANFRDPNGDEINGGGAGGSEGGSGGEPEELSDRKKTAAKAFRERARQTDSDVWAEIAEDIESGSE